MATIATVVPQKEVAEVPAELAAKVEVDTEDLVEILRSANQLARLARALIGEQGKVFIR
jgi:hypothetical protein